MRPISYRIGYQGETKINSVEVHPQLSNIGHPVDGALVGAGSLWPSSGICEHQVLLWAQISFLGNFKVFREVQKGFFLKV